MRGGVKRPRSGVQSLIYIYILYLSISLQQSSKIQQTQW